MRRATTAAFATVVLATTVAATPLAAAAPAQDPLAPVDCASLGLLADPTCLVVEEVEALVAPVEDAVTEQLAPVAPAPEPVAPAPGDDTPTPAPQPAPRSDTQATSSGSATSADLGGQPAFSAGAALPRSSSSPAVPDVPAGATLELGPLALPSFGLGGNPAVTADELAAGQAVADDVVLPAARAAAELPDDSKTTAVVMAFSLLLLAAGLLLDQLRKARVPVQL